MTGPAKVFPFPLEPVQKKGHLWRWLPFCLLSGGAADPPECFLLSQQMEPGSFTLYLHDLGPPRRWDESCSERLCGFWSGLPRAGRAVPNSRLSACSKDLGLAFGAPSVAKTNVTSGAEPQRHWASLLMLQLPPIYHLSIQLRGGLLVLCAGYTHYRIISVSRNSQSKLRQDCSERSRKNWKRGGRKMGNRNLAPILSFLVFCLFVWGKRFCFLEWSPSTSYFSPVYICQYLVLILHL